MRAFIVLCCVAIASADVGGYNYQAGSTGGRGGGGNGGIGSGNLGGLGGGLGGNGGGLGGSGGGLGGLGGGLGGLGGGLGGLGGGQGGLGGGQGGLGGGLGGLGGLGGGSNGGNGLGGNGLGGSGLGGNGLGGNGLGGNGGGGNDGGDSSSSIAGPSEFEKEFFTFSADEKEFEDPNGAQQLGASLQKSLRVVFIKGPENKGLEDAALALAKQASDQQTAIYVLSKQTDLGDLANKLNQIRSGSSNKPDVHFVKYRTPEDAANAQRAIQGQYDNLGGQSQAHDGGVAPVINFASQAPIRTPTAQTPNNAYLPSNVFRRLR